MAGRQASCAVCGATLSATARECPRCHTPVGPDGGGRGSPGVAEGPLLGDLPRRLARLTQWADAAETLGVELPSLAKWAEEAATRSRNPEAWSEVVRGVERLAQRRLNEAFDRWEERTNGRIGRLEAYSVDSRLERGQVEDAVHAAKVGDVAQALATFQQVDRVVALKERHLDQARGDLERLVAFLKDLEAIGLVETGEPAEVAVELERDLRTGRLAPLKSRLRLLRSRAVARSQEALPELVARLGDRLVPEVRGHAELPDARELATAARAIVLGHAEDGARRIRALSAKRGLLPAPRPRAAAGDRASAG